MWQVSPGVITNVALQGTAVAGTDPNFATVKHLFGWEGTDNTNTPITEESNGRTGSAQGNAQYDTAQFKYGASSLLLDGSGDRVIFLDLTDYDFAAAFMIECWFKINSLTAAYLLCKDTSGAGVRSWGVGTNADGSVFGYVSLNGTALTTLTSAASQVSADGNFHHLAFGRDGSDNLRLHLDGVLKAGPTSLSGATFNSTAQMNIGARSDGLAGFFNGWIDETRINQAHCYYPSDSSFTPPTAAFPRSA